MKLIGIRNNHLGIYKFYRGVDYDIIKNHALNPNDTMMLIFATAKEFLDNIVDEDKRISSDYIALYEIPELYNDGLKDDYIVEKFWNNIEQSLDNTPKWFADAGAKRGKISGINEL